MVKQHQKQSYVVIPYSFRAVRVFGDRLISAQISLKIHLQPKAQEKGASEPTKCVERLYSWLDKYLDDSVLVSVTSKFFEPAHNFENELVYCPETPTNTLLSQLFHSKIDQLIKSSFYLIKLVVSSDDSGLTECHFCSADGYDLPGIEYIGDECVDKLPWWSRDDFYTREVIRSQTDTDVDTEENADDGEASIIMFEFDPEAK